MQRRRLRSLIRSSAERLMDPSSLNVAAPGPRHKQRTGVSVGDVRSKKPQMDAFGYTKPRTPGPEIPGDMAVTCADMARY